MTEKAVDHAEVAGIVHEMAPSPGPRLPSAEAGLVDDLGFTSLRLVELTMVLEETFGLEPLSREDVAGVDTVGDVVAMLRRARGTAS